MPKHSVDFLKKYVDEKRWNIVASSLSRLFLTFDSLPDIRFEMGEHPQNKGRLYINVDYELCDLAKAKEALEEQIRLDKSP
jgi:hypothetical protein